MTFDFKRIIKLTKAIQICIVMLVFSLSLNCCSKEEKSEDGSSVVRPVKMMILKGAETELLRSFPGKTRASQQVDLAFRVSGPLVSFPVNEGQMVQEGDILATIDPRDFKTQLAQIESALAEAHARDKSMKAGIRPEDLKILESEVAAAEASFKEAELHYERFKKLYEQKNISKAEFDGSKAAFNIAKAQLDAASLNLEKGRKGARKEDLEAMKSVIDGLKAQLEIARSALSDTYLKAPFSGFVAKKYVRNFEKVQAFQPILSLQDLSEIEVLIHVTGKIMATADEKHLEINVEFEALPGREFEATLKEWDTDADPLTKTYEVTLVMSRPEDVILLPGMVANVNVLMKSEGSGEGHVDVPADAVFGDENDRSFVWIVDKTKMTVSRREITIGELSGQHVRIVNGLRPGELIVIAGVHYLTENQKVRPFEKEE